MTIMVKKLEYRSQPVHYSIYGEGTAVVLLHGFGEDDTIWNNIIPHLVNNKVIIPVIPGSGGTPMHSSAMLEDHAEWLNEILVSEKIDKIILAGHSMGGYIALAFAEKYPGKINALCLFHSSAFADDDEKKETRRKAIEFIRKNGSRAFMETSTPNLFYNTARNKKHIESLVEKASHVDPEALVQYYEAMIARPDRTEILKRASWPVLFILGEHDKAVPFETGLKQTYMPENAYINILRESGHMGMLEEPQKAVEILVKFIEEIKS